MAVHAVAWLAIEVTVSSAGMITNHQCSLRKCGFFLEEEVAAPCGTAQLSVEH
jgi:hypothetical protein